MHPSYKTYFEKLLRLDKSMQSVSVNKKNRQLRRSVAVLISLLKEQEDVPKIYADEDTLIKYSVN